MQDDEVEIKFVIVENRLLPEGITINDGEYGFELLNCGTFMCWLMAYDGGVKIACPQENPEEVCGLNFHRYLSSEDCVIVSSVLDGLMRGGDCEFTMPDWLVYL